MPHSAFGFASPLPRRRVWINRPPSAPPNSPSTEPGSQLRLVDLGEGGEVRMGRTPGVSRGVLRGAMRG